MPIYQYQCPECEVVIEEIRDVERRNDEVICQNCGVPAVRQIRSVPVHFKGSGFHVTDNRIVKGKRR